MKRNQADLHGLEQQIDDYLDGLLGRAESRALERLLVDPDVAALLAEALAFRDLLIHAPPVAPPEGLNERIIAALEVQAPAPEPARVRDLGRAQPIIHGVGMMRYLLAPVAWLRPEPTEPRPLRSYVWPILRFGFGR